jgi:shikimate kinase
MILKKNLIFLGMMGSGKSTIGFLVSKKLNLDFIDIDIEIENRAGMKIHEIFNKKGENYFRSLEEKITLKFLKVGNIVIALGGGAFINSKIRKQILTNHTSFFLDVDIETLINRIKGNKKRPLAFKSTNQEIKDLQKKRSRIYQKAQFRVDCTKLTKSEIVKNIIEIYASK